MKRWNRIIFASAALAAIFGVVSRSASAQTTHGAVYGWGYNYYGDPGAGSYHIYNTPVPVSGLGDVVQATVIPATVGGFDGYTMLLKPDGTVWGRGKNNHGQLGDGTFVDSNVFVQALGLTNVVEIAGTDHVAALKSDGTVWVWGWNFWGQLGNGTQFIDSNVPLQVPGLSNVVDISAGFAHTLAVKSDGTVWAWGWTSYGLGNGDTSSLVPVQVSSLGNVLRVEAGNQNLLLKSDGTVWAWGDNSWGQVGDGTRYGIRPVPLPVTVPGVGPAAGSLKIVDIAVGGGHSLAVRSDGTVWAWGWNGEGELGNGVRDISTSPVQVSNLGNVKAVSGGYLHSLALKSDGTVWTWGNNIWSELGVGQDFANLPYSLTPVQVTSLNNVVTLPKGPGTHSLAIVSSNTTTPFASADAKLTITAGPPSGFDLKELITLGAGSNGVNPVSDAVTLQIGPYTVTFPAGSFRALPNGKFVFAGVIGGVSLSAQFDPVSANSFNFKASALGVNLTSVTNPVTVFVTIGDDSGTTTTIAKFN